MLYLLAKKKLHPEMPPRCSLVRATSGVLLSPAAVDVENVALCHGYQSTGKGVGV